jgi:hypothetical protein
LKAVEWIRACIVIHTLIHHIEDGVFDYEWQEEMIQDGLSTSSNSSEDIAMVDDEPELGLRLTEGERKRRKIKKALFDSGITTN